MKQSNYHLRFSCIPRHGILLLILLSFLFSAAQPASASKIGFREPNGTWRVVEESQWSRVAGRVVGVGKKISPIVGKTTFEVRYLDATNHTGIGFDDPVSGPARQAAVDAVLKYISSTLNKTGTCQIDFLASETDASGFLAAGGPYFSVNGPYEESFSERHILTGVDPSATTPDIEVTVDFGWQWHDTTATNPGGKYDLYSVLLHEITHGLGLISLTNPDGTSAFSPSVVFTTWDDLLYTGNGVKLWNSSGIFAGNVGYLTGSDGGVLFRGPLATNEFASYPGIYAPAVYSSGSSIGHWAANLAGNPVMLHSIAAGTMRRTYAPFEIQALSDIGYNIELPVASAGNWQLYQ